MLTRAGVGRISIIDRDYVEWSNLGRQQLYTEEDARQCRPKAKAAERRLHALNSTIEITGITAEFTPENAEHYLENVDILIDGTDNFDTRFLINDVTAKRNIPWIYGGCVKSIGVSLAITPGVTPCLQCLVDIIPQEGETCDTAGVIGPAVQMTAAQQTTECLKFLTGHQMSSEMVYFDLWDHQYSVINVTKQINQTCPTCSTQATYPFLRKERGVRTTVLCGRDTVQVRPEEPSHLTLAELAQKLKRVVQKIRENDELLMFQIDHIRFVVFKDGRTLIHGINDVKEAKKMYQRYIGA